MPIDHGTRHGHKPVQQRDGEPSQLRLHHEIPENVAVPDKPLIRPVVKRVLEEVGTSLQQLIPSLQGVSNVIVIGIEESRGIQYSTDHAQVGLVVLLLNRILGTTSFQD